MTATQTTTTPTSAAPMGEESPSKVLVAMMASEWTKLRSVRSTMWSLLATVGITVGFGTLFCAALSARYERLDIKEKLTVDPTSISLQGLVLSSLAIGVLGVLAMSSEYATGMIRSTLTAAPQRTMLLTAKILVFGGVALVVSMGSAFVSFGLGQAILSGKHLGTSLSDPDVLRAVLGAGTYLTIIGLMGLGLGAILRRTAGAVATLVGVVFIADILVQALPSPWNHDVAKFLPGIAGISLFSVRDNADRLSPGPASIVLIAWVTASLAFAFVLLKRRDA